MSETGIVGSMEIWRQNAKEIERAARDDATELIREEIERIEEAEAVVEENEDGFGEGRDDDAEDEDFGREEKKKRKKKKNKENSKWTMEGDLKLKLEKKLLKRKEQLLNLKKDNRDQELMKYQKYT
jgi:hypothetical protein